MTRFLFTISVTLMSYGISLGQHDELLPTDNPGHEVIDEVISPEPLASEPSLGLWAIEANESTYPNVDLGGLLQLDTGWFSQSARNIDAVGRALDGTSFRSARLWGRGSLRENLGYMVEMDFGGLGIINPGRPVFQNAYIEMEDLPYLGTLRVGRWKQPFTLETMTSIRFLSFIERASLFAFIPFRRTGIGFFDATPNERWTYAASLFRPSDDGYGGYLVESGSGVATAGRLTHLLVDANDGADLIHLGVAHTSSQAPRDRVRFARFGEFAVNQTPVNGLSLTTPNQFDTGIIHASHFNNLGTELAWVRGPFSIQAEGVLSFVDRNDASMVVFHGWYAYASWFLTGEHRRYIRQAGAFDRVQPRREFRFSRAGGFRGSGAWEALVRVSQVDVNAGGVDGGNLTGLTLGLNWHLASNAKFQFNYIHNIRHSMADGGSHFDVFGLRAAFDF